MYLYEYIASHPYFCAIREVLNQIQSMEPNGRFLLKNYKTYEWDVVKDSVAREKVCQVSIIQLIVSRVLNSFGFCMDQLI